MKRTHSKKDKHKAPAPYTKRTMDDDHKYGDPNLPFLRGDPNLPFLGGDVGLRRQPMKIKKGQAANIQKEMDIRDGYDAHRKYAPGPQDVEMKQEGKIQIATRKHLDDFFNVNPTDLNSIYSSPEIIYNPAGSMSYLNPQDPLMPRQIFSNTPYINSQPSINNPIYKRPLNPLEMSIKNTTAIEPVKKIIDSLIPSSVEDSINYTKEFTKLPTKRNIEEFADVSENKAIYKDVENINFARKEINNMKSSIDSFFDGADLDRQSFDRGDDPMSGYQKRREATSSHYDNYSGKVINPRSVVNNDDIGATVNGLNLAALPFGNELVGRTNNTYMDPYYNTNTNNLKADLVSQLNFNNLLLGENSIYARPKDMDLLESSKSDGYNRDDNEERTANGGRNFNSSLNFKTLNKRSLSGKNRSSKNKWIGTGQRGNLQPTLSDVRSAKIPVRIPNMYYKGNQVNLVRRANQTTDLMSSQYEP